MSQPQHELYHAVEEHVRGIWAEFQKKHAPEYLREVLVCIVALRRNVDPHIDAPALLYLLEEYQDEILEYFSSRWLVSICDTLADHAPAPDKYLAMIISTTFNHIRLMESHRDVLISDEIDQEYFATHKQVPLWDGFLTFNLRYGDTFENLYAREDKLLQEHAVLWKIWKQLLHTMQQHDNLMSSFAHTHQHNLIGKNLWP